MKNFVPTRSVATVVMTLGVTLVLALAVMLPFTHMRTMMVVYVAMIVFGTGMLLRERVFPPRRRASAVPETL